MHHDVSAELDRLNKDWSHRVVDNEWYAVLMGDSCQELNVSNVAGWVSNTLAKNGARIFIDEPLHRVLVDRPR